MITCLIVEDEPLAADVLLDYARQVSFLSVVKVCTDAIQALEVLQEKSIDLIFLDIHLPGLKGLDFLKTLKNPPAVIITTAYHEYALQGYELNVVDYLLKPIEFKRFLEAVNKVKTPAQPRKETISIHSDKKTVIIPLNEILFIESQKEYISIQTTSGKHSSKYALSKIEEELNPEKFLRVHRSFIVAIEQIKAFNATAIEIPGKSIPIGGNYREPIIQKLEALFK
jgi:DNA-binding LytR/AlgR family response regulator